MKIAVDVMGTDYGPAEIIKGVLQAVKEYGCDAVLVGDEDVIKAELRREHEENNPHVTIHHASEVIEMKDHPGISVKKKRDASIVVATDLLRQKECDALVSSGSTGAAVASALFGLGRIKGIERPAIATVIPSLTGATVLLDSGAKVDAKPEQLVQSAIMGSVYAESQLGIKNPRVSTREPPRLFVYIEQFLGKETRIWHFLWTPERCSWGAWVRRSRSFLLL